MKTLPTVPRRFTMAPTLAVLVNKGVPGGRGWETGAQRRSITHPHGLPLTGTDERLEEKMDESQRMVFEREFHDKPIRIGGFELITDEVLSVYSHGGLVTCPIYPSEEDESAVVDEVNPFLLQLTPMEARNLAGLLIYAAGRADETAQHCITCGDTVEDGDEHHEP